MLVLVTAVVTASLLGSMHCVGMCGNHLRDRGFDCRWDR